MTKPSLEFEQALISSLPLLRKLAKKFKKADYEDLVQDAFCKAWEHWRNLDGLHNMERWLTAILKNDYYTKYCKAKWTAEDPDEVLAAKLMASDDPLRTLEAKQALHIVCMLPSVFSEPLLLVADGVSIEEVAYITGEHAGTIKSRVGRARAMLDGRFETYR